MQPLQVVLSLGGIVVVIIACYYVTYYIGVKATGRSRLRNKNINLIDRFAVTRDKSFCLVEIAGKVYIIGVTNQSMTLIDTLDAAVFAESAPERHDMASFAPVQGGSLKSRLINKLAAFIAARMGKTPKSGGKADGGSFADSMKNAREKSSFGQPGAGQPERADMPEGDG